MTFVKICGMTDRKSVSAAVDAGADAVGFVFAESVRKVTPAIASDLAAQIPEKIRKVAVMLHPKPGEWRQVFEIFAPDVLQTDFADLESLDINDSVEVWPVFRQGAAVPADNTNRTFVYEGSKSGQGETVDWDLAAQVAKHGNMILAGGLSAENISQAVSIVRPFGVDVSSAVESAPGRKDAGKIRAFVEAVRNTDVA